MRIETTRGVDGWCLRPDGPLVGEAAAALRRELLDPARRSDPRVVLDLKQVPYIDSAGLECLVEASRELEALGGGLETVGVAGALALIFEATRMQGHLVRPRRRTVPGAA